MSGNQYTRNPRPSQERFEEKLIAEPMSGCLLWTGAQNGQGYDSFGMDNTGDKHIKPAHRIAYEMHVGPIPEGFDVLHHCDTPPCCNEHHLFLGKDFDNVHGAMKKGRRRYRRGEKHPRSKLTDAQAAEIRQDARKHRIIAQDYGVSESTIEKIKGNRWRISQDTQRHQLYRRQGEK
jgi:hypothetical protein